MMPSIAMYSWETPSIRTDKIAGASREASIISAERIADRMSESLFKGLDHESGKCCGLAGFVYLDLFRHFEFAILDYHVGTPLNVSYYTRRRFRARHPLCGTGVQSRMIVIASPALCSPRTADSRPAPGPFKFTSHSFIPTSIASRAAFCAATVAANAEDFRDPEKFDFPAEDHATNIARQVGDADNRVIECSFHMGNPSRNSSLNLLFNADASFFRRRFLFLLCQGSNLLYRSLNLSCSQRFCACPYGCGNSCGFAGRVPAVPSDGASRDSN